MFVLALEIAEDARDIRDLKKSVHQEIAILVGNEVEGIPPDVICACSGVGRIIMQGAKRSLNVSVAESIAMFVFAE